VGNEPFLGDAGDEPSKSYASLKVGDIDPRLGVKIKEILLVNGLCIVYIDQELSLQWYWRFALDPKVAARIFNRAGDLEAKAQFLRYLKTPKEDQNTPRDLLSAVRLIGEGVVELFSTQDLTYANAALDTADKFITQRGREISRSWYFVPFLGFFAASIIGMSVAYCIDSTLFRTIAVACMCAGGVGSFISRALDNKNIPVAATAGRALHCIEATLRWCIGLTAGLIVWLLVTGNIAGSFLNTHAGNDSSAGQNTFALIAFAVLAGASERLFPSLIRTFDESIKKNGQQNSDIARQ
jgi:hypothetical protein